MNRLLFFLFIILNFSNMPLYAQELAKPTVTVGDMATTFTLKDVNGVDTSFEDIKKKQAYVALVFLRSADW